MATKNLSEERWRNIGLELGRITEASQWWIGDWWAFGEHRYGDRKRVIESENWTGPSYQACKDAASVCRAFKRSLRNDLLTFGHHRVLQAVDSDEAQDLLDWCAAPLKNGAKKAKSVAQLQEERLRRSNRTILEAALALVEGFLAPFIDQPKKKLMTCKKQSLERRRGET